MQALLAHLTAHKPPGWSAVLGDRELVVRTSDRSVGKFRVTVSPPRQEPTFCLAFFSAASGHWVDRAYFPLSVESGTAMLAWAAARV